MKLRSSRQRVAPFGVLGEYSSTAFGVGVAGVSTTGYGVVGESSSNTQASILAYPAGNFDGLDSTTTGSATANAVSGIGKGNSIGVYAQALTSGNGVYGESYTGNAIMGYTRAATGGVGILGAATGEGLIAQGYSGTSADPALSVVAASSRTQVATFSNSSSNATQLIIQPNSQNRSHVTATTNSDLQIRGDLYLVGKIYENCNAYPATASTSCYDVGTTGSYGTTGVARSADGREMQTYNARQTLPTIEDFGQGKMVGRAAFVRIDPSFADLMSPDKPYLVFVTPQGSSKGLYVVNRSTTGFEVRENESGRSTMLFDYRIVAAPLNDQSERLPAVVKSRFEQPGSYVSIASVTKHKASLERLHAPITPPIRTR